VRIYTKRIDIRGGWKNSGYIKKTRCERCDSYANLVVHHRDRDPLNNSDHDDLETICRKCHNLEHGAEKAKAISHGRLNMSSEAKELHRQRIAKAMTPEKHHARLSKGMKTRWSKISPEERSRINKERRAKQLSKGGITEETREKMRNSHLKHR
jgi:hypothetical protein